MQPFGIRKLSIDELQSDIAIIGIACRFPGANHYTQFWDNLIKGVNSIKEISPDRWDVNKFYSLNGDLPNKTVSKWGGLLDQIDQFDNHFFHISAREAQVMDPQQRLLLEETWHCIEDAGISLKELQQHRTSVYVGVMAIDYQHHLFNPEHIIDSYESIGNYEGILANRLSYFFNLTGESQSIDTACASSLVSLHDACRSLMMDESEYAISAGVNVICHSWHYVSFSKSRMLSPDGQCKTFDAAADGYVPGEGVGVLLLCPLKKAIEKNYHIYGVIKGSAVKHTGKSKSITAPRVEIERQVVEEALESSQISPESITYVEAHGTGTSLGDPIEVEALTQAFKTSKKQYCRIGSVKTNIGHLEAAAGVASIIKVLLMMQHRKIPQTLNIKKLNPIIDFDNSPFSVADKLYDWDLPKDIKLRRAGISSFGFGGVNAHVVLEEFPQEKQKEIAPSKLPLSFILSATNAGSLKKILNEWKKYIHTADFQTLSIKDICHTLMFGREAFHYRFSSVVESKQDIAKIITELNIDQTDFIDTHANLKKKLISLQIANIKNDLFPVYSELHESFLKFPVLVKLEEECIQKIKNLPDGENLWQTISQGVDPQSRLLQQFIVLYILSKALLISGLHPRDVQGEGVGLLVSTVVTGMLDFEAAINWIIGKNKDIHLKRPIISFYDLYSKQIIEPYVITKEYFVKLINQLFLDKKIKDALFQKSSQLMISQFTFKKYLAEWTDILKNIGITISTDLQDPYKLDENKQLLLSIILLVSLHKLSKKWDLVEKIAIDNTILTEVIDLLLDKVLPSELFVELILNRQEATYEKAANYLSKHQNRLNPHKPYALLKQFNQELTEIVDAKAWLNQRLQNLPMTSNLVTEKDDFYFVDMGQLNLTDLIKSLPHFLTKLWSDGVPIHWKLWYGKNEYHKVVLPTYSFMRERYWIKETEASGKLPPTKLTEQILSTILKSENVYYYQPMWIEEKLVDNKEKVIKPSNLILAFDDTGNIVKSLKIVLPHQTIIRVIPGENYQKINSNEYKINTVQAEDYTHLLRDISENFKLPDYIIYKLNLTDAETLSESVIQSQLQLSYYPLFYLSHRNHLDPLIIQLD